METERALTSQRNVGCLRRLPDFVQEVVNIALCLFQLDMADHPRLLVDVAFRRQVGGAWLDRHRHTWFPSPIGGEPIGITSTETFTAC